MISRHFRARVGGTDYAFLVLDFPQDSRWLVLYELYVAPNVRRQGIGSAVLTAVERYAKVKGYLGVRLIPHPLDEDTDAATLRAFYSRRGYIASAVQSDLLEKAV